MACFKCPDKLTKAIDIENMNFLWGKDFKLSLVAWDKVCYPKENGAKMPTSTMLAWQS